MLNRFMQIFLWLLRIAVPLTLAGMLVIPILLTPPIEAMSAAKAHSPGAALVLIGAGENQYTFARLSDPTFLTVQLAVGSPPSVVESRTGMLLWLVFVVILAVATWRLWRPVAPPNNSFKPKPLRGSA